MLQDLNDSGILESEFLGRQTYEASMVYTVLNKLSTLHKNSAKTSLNLFALEKQKQKLNSSKNRRSASSTRQIIHMPKHIFHLKKKEFSALTVLYELIHLIFRSKQSGEYYKRPWSQIDPYCLPPALDVPCVEAGCRSQEA